jgi:hypothetical protein
MMCSLEELLSSPDMSQILLSEWYKKYPEENSRLIRIVSAKAGAGKTLGLTKEISENPQKSLIVCQTIALLDQTKQTLIEYARFPPQYIHSFHSKNVVRHVQTEVINFLNDADKNELGCTVLIITLHTYIELMGKNSKWFRDWVVYIDEIPPVDSKFEYQIPDRYQYLSDWLDIEDININGSARLILRKDKSKSSLQSHLDNKCKRNDTDRLFTPIFKAVINPYIDIRVDTESWKTITENVLVDKKDDMKNKIFSLGMMKPELFMGCTILGANIEHSLMYDYWKNHQGIEIDANQPLIDRLFNTNGDLSERVRIHYLSDVNQNSKSLKAKMDDHGEIMIDTIERELLSRIGEETKVIYVGNNCDELPLMGNASGWERMSVENKGLNQYKHYTNIVFLPALNRTPMHTAKLRDWFGISPETLRRSTQYEVMYQSIMRTALRDGDSKEVVNVFVTTKKEGEWLMTLLGGGLLKKFQEKDFIKYKPRALTDVERRLNSVGRKKSAEKLKKMIVEPENAGNLYDFSKENTIDKTCKKVAFQMTGHFDINSLSDAEFTQYKGSILEYSSAMRHLSHRIIENKSDNFLLNTGIYKRQIGFDRSLRCLGNHQESSSIQIDIDDGCLTPEQMVDILDTNTGYEQKFSFILYNSFSRSEDQPNRYRIQIFIDRYIDQNDYKRIYLWFVSYLQTKTMKTCEELGLDETAANPTQSQYAPATNRENPDWHCFYAKNVDSRAASSAVLKIDEILKSTVREPETFKLAKVEESDVFNFSKSTFPELPDSKYVRKPDYESFNFEKNKLKAMQDGSGRHTNRFSFAVNALKKWNIPFQDVSLAVKSICDAHGKPKHYQQIVRSLEGYGHI